MNPPMKLKKFKILTQTDVTLTKFRFQIMTGYLAFDQQGNKVIVEGAGHLVLLQLSKEITK